MRISVRPNHKDKIMAAVGQITLSSKIRADELTDEEVNAVTELFEPFKVGEQVYGPNNANHPQTIRVYNGVLYKCASDHITSTDPNWAPDIAGTLWSRVAKTVDGYEIWKVWDGLNENLYQVDDIVWYPDAGDALYIATEGNNHWRPDEYGWAIYEG